MFGSAAAFFQSDCGKKLVLSRKICYHLCIY